MDKITEQIDFTDTMQPIIRLAMADFETQLEGTIMCCVQNVHVDEDKDRLVQALTDARKFYDEGYRAGYRCAKAEQEDETHAYWIDGADSFGAERGRFRVCSRCNICFPKDDRIAPERFWRGCPNCFERMEVKSDG